MTDKRRRCEVPHGATLFFTDIAGYKQQVATDSMVNMDVHRLDKEHHVHRLVLSDGNCIDMDCETAYGLEFLLNLGEYPGIPN